MARIALLFFLLTSLVRAGTSPVYGEALRILHSAEQTRYQHETYVNEARGIYFFDCSGFIDYVIERLSPEAYAEIPAPDRPLAKHFVSFFSDLGAGGSSRYFIAVSDPAGIKRGDILAWLTPGESESKNTGHAMIARSRPRASRFHDGELAVDIVDSTSSGHGSDDPRGKEGPDGLGVGTIALVVSQGEAVDTDGPRRALSLTRLPSP